MDKYIGMDIDCKKTVCCVLEPELGRKHFFTIGSNVDEMKVWLDGQRKRGDRLHATFEVGGHAGFLYDELLDKTDSLTVSNPSKMTWIYRTSKKNDRIDAEKQAVLLSIGQIPSVHMPSKEVRGWRELIKYRQKAVSDVTCCKNRIGALMKSRGIAKKFSSYWWSIVNRAWMCELAKQGNEDWHFMLADRLLELASLEQRRDRVTSRLDERGSQHPGITLLKTIPGVGPRTAEAIIAYADDISRFSNSKKFAAYFGVTPRLDESGSYRRIGHISKEGPSVARWLIVESAWRCIRKCSVLKKFYERVRRGMKERKKIAIVAVARKLLTIMRAMLTTGETFNPNLVMNCNYLAVEAIV